MSNDTKNTNNAASALLRTSRKRWDELGQQQKNAVTFFVVLDGVLKAAAYHFLYHLPATKIRGPKWAWTMVTTLSGSIGPATFLLFGIKR